MSMVVESIDNYAIRFAENLAICREIRKPSSSPLMGFAKNPSVIGKPPGGDIFIDCGPRRGVDPTDKLDWTAECILIAERQIEEVYAMVRDWTPIDIFA